MMLGQTGTTPAPSRASQGVAGGRLANISRGYCWTRGYPGISYVGLGNGTPIGRAARWDASAVTTITLAPRQHADATIRMVIVQNYPASVCRPTPADGCASMCPAPHSRSSSLPYDGLPVHERHDDLRQAAFPLGPQMAVAATVEGRPPRPGPMRLKRSRA